MVRAGAGAAAAIQVLRKPHTELQGWGGSIGVVTHRGSTEV